ncbi:MAG: trypsin-like serine protease [Rhodospirillaceae bacterium]|nr:MAG: trypsin-like serine protease [Rhodospirillaceae bacterium]
MMTMGGGVLQVAGLMMFFGYGMALIRPVACLTNVFVYGAAAWRNTRAGLVAENHIRPLIPWGIAGVVIGYFVGTATNDRIIAIALGLFAFLMALKTLHDIFSGFDGTETLPAQKDTGDAVPTAQNGIARRALLGVPMGLVNGILGISGGVVEVRLQRYYRGMSLAPAIANSSVLVFWASVSGAAVAYIHGVGVGLIDWDTPLALTLFMVPGAFVGGALGARLLKVLAPMALQWIYTALMLGIAVKLLAVA